MQPEQPLPPATPPPSQFDFIMNSGNAAGNKKQADGPKAPGGDMKQRILMVLLGFVGLIVLVMIFQAITSNSGKGNNATLLSVAQQQTELIRVSDLGIAKARSASNKNLAATVSVTMKTSQKDVLKIITSHKGKVLPAELGLKHSALTDAQLTSADQNNTYDDTFHTILLNNLITYQKSVKAAYDGTSNVVEKKLLSKSYNGADLIIKSQTAK